MLRVNFCKKISLLYFEKPLRFRSLAHFFHGRCSFSTEKASKHLPAPYLTGLLGRWKIKKNNIKQVYDNILAQLASLNALVSVNDDNFKLNLKEFKEKLEETGLESYFFSEKHAFFREAEFESFLKKFIFLMKSTEDPWEYMELLDIANTFHFSKYKIIEQEIYSKLLELSADHEGSLPLNKIVVIKICAEFPQLFSKLPTASQIIKAIGGDVVLITEERIEFLLALSAILNREFLQNDEIYAIFNKLLTKVKTDNIKADLWGKLLLSVLRAKQSNAAEQRYTDVIHALLKKYQLNSLHNITIIKLFNIVTLTEESLGKLRMNLYEEILRRLPNFSVIDLEQLLEIMTASDSNTAAIKFRLDNEILFKKSIVIDIFQKRLFNQSQNVVFHSKILIKLMSRLPVYEIKEQEILRKCEELCCLLFEFERIKTSELILTYKYILKSASNTQFAPRNMEQIIEKLFQEGKIEEPELLESALNILISMEFMKSKLTQTQILFLLEHAFKNYALVNKMNLPYLCDLAIFLSRKLQEHLASAKENEQQGNAEHEYIISWLSEFVLTGSPLEIITIQQMFLKNLILRPRFLGQNNGVLRILFLISARFEEKKLAEFRGDFFSNYEEIFKANKKFFKLNAVDFPEKLPEASATSDLSSPKIIFPFPKENFSDFIRTFPRSLKKFNNIMDVIFDSSGSEPRLGVEKNIVAKPGDSLNEIAKALMSNTKAREKLSESSPTIDAIKLRLEEFYSKPVALGDDESLNSAFFLTEFLNFKRKLTPDLIRLLLDYMRKGNFELKSNLLLKAHSILNSYSKEYTGELRKGIFLGIMNNLDRKMLNHSNAYELIMGFPLKSFDLGTLNYLENLIADHVMHFDLVHLGKVLEKFQKSKIHLPLLIKKIGENLKFLLKDLRSDRQLDYACQIIDALKANEVFNKNDLKYLTDISHASLVDSECLHRYILLHLFDLLGSSKQSFLTKLREINASGTFEGFDCILHQLILKPDHAPIERLLKAVKSDAISGQLTQTKLNFAAELLTQEQGWLRQSDKTLLLNGILEHIYKAKKHEYFINSLFLLEYNRGLVTDALLSNKDSLNKFLGYIKKMLDFHVDRPIGNSDLLARLVYIISCQEFKGKYEILHRLKMQQWRLVMSNELYCKADSLKLIFSSLALNSLELHSFFAARNNKARTRSEFDQYLLDDEEAEGESLKNIPMTLYDEFTLNRLENQVTKAKKYYKDDEFRLIYLFYVNHQLGSATILKFLEETLGLLENTSDRNANDK